MSGSYRIEKLRREHPVERFTCGSDALDNFLVRHALSSQSSHASQSYVGLAGAEIVGYYTLVVGQVEREQAPERVVQGLGRYPVPLMILARLAVATAFQGRGIGAGLLKDAMRRTAQAAEIGGIRALATHAKDDPARDFYRHFGFMPSPTDPLHLFVLMKDVIRAMG